ncbi:MAG: ATP-binding protein [Lachnospiraceae bacterium]|nr:ATP-binding protein [Lachnospiraceae bacterium]
MASSIVDIKNMGDAFRNTGYKNIESAAAEIVDNSVEANAKNVFMIISESINPLSGRKVVTEIGFLDNGDGMDIEVLGRCLGIGATTRQARKGMGRFGVGLPQASLHVCPEVEVYSWQNGIENCHKVFLDINKVKAGIQTQIDDPEFIKVPDKYANYLSYKTLLKNYDFKQSGTLVIWKKCDRVIPKTRGPLTQHLEFALGRKFRHFINQEICEIKIICDENQECAIDVLPNDPLFLMKNNYVMCHKDEPKAIYKSGQKDGIESVFEPYTADGIGNGEVDIPVKYIDKMGQIAESIVKARFSIVKSTFYDETAFPHGTNPGAYNFGKHAAKLEGISIIRANREIDFGKFDFYSDTNKPQHRWWGCEIVFNPELDEAFGVANNKQYVDLKKVAEEDIDYEEEVQPMWNQLCEYIQPTIDAMYKKNEETRKNTRSFDDVNVASTNIINTVEIEDELDEDEDTIVENPLANVTDDEIVQIGKEELENLGFEDVTDEQASKFFNNKVIFDYADKGERSPAFDYKVVLSTTVITINISHKFYTSFLSKLYNSIDARTTFELFLASFFQSIRKTNAYQEAQNDKLITMWYSKLNDYITEQLNPRK